MLAAKWDNTNAPPSYWAVQLSKARRASPWIYVLTFIPFGLVFLEYLATHKPTLTPLPVAFLTWIPMAIREIPRRLVLPENLAAVFDKQKDDAIPCDATITNNADLLGDDEGVLYVDDDALVFQGKRCQFVLYNDMVESFSDKADQDSPELSTITLSYGAETIKVKFRQRSYSEITSDSGRLHRVLKHWSEGGATRTIEACLPPLEPNAEAHFSITSAVVWTSIAIIWLVASWIFAIRGLRSASAEDTVPTVSIYIIVTVSTIVCGWVAFYGTKLVLKRTAFYARFEELNTIRS